ncbi:MAG: thioredoxin family protein [Saprospiraceae bacterium]|nr:thioredoxin family protein [Saprospiraceae bacterium]
MQVLQFSKVLRVAILALFVISATFMNAQTSMADYEPENEGWLVDINKAYELSKETNKPILANFTGSDWCGWCKRLTKSVFVHDEFKEWAKKNVILLELDYPKRKQLPAQIVQQNQSLQRAFGIRGYPTIFVFDLDKNEKNEFSISALGKTNYKRTVKEFTDDVDAMLVNRNSGE